MRTHNSIKNILISLSFGLIATLLGFVAQKIFIKVLDIEYLGVNGLFTSVISMLAVIELGLGSAIVYHLYKPLAENDRVRINALMNFYKFGYRVVGFAVLLIGLAIMPILPLLTSSTELPINLYVIFALFVSNAAASYFMSYKRSILYADQKNYIVNTVHIGAVVVLNIAQIITLILTHNYYLFLILKVLSTLAENIILNHIVDRRYNALKLPTEKLDIKTRRDIFLKMKGLLLHKIGDFVVLGTDNVILAVFFGLKTVGLYSNYLLILTALNTIFSQLSTALTASVGSLLLGKDKKKNVEVFRKIYFANFWISSVVAVSFFAVVNPFIGVWLGDKYIFSIEITSALTVSLFLSMLRMPIQTFKTAAGIFYEDRFMPILETAINLVLSLILLHLFGVMGVFLGTICSTLFLHLYSYPKYTYTKLFEKRWSEYWLLIAKSIVIAASIAAVAFYLSIQLVSEQPAWLQLAWSMLIGLTLPNIVLYVIYRKTDEYAYFMNLAKGGVKKMLGLIRNVRIRK